MKQLITSERIKAIIAQCKTEKAVLQALKAHKIRFTQDEYSATLNIYIATKTGKIRIYRACSRQNPFVVQTWTKTRFVCSGIPTFRPSIPYGAQTNELY